MDAPYAALLEKTRLPQPSLQRFAVVSLFRLLESSHGALNLDAISHCLRSSSAAVVDQSVRELCRLAGSGVLVSVSVALIELQSALEGCEPRFSPVFVKGIGFLCRLGFRNDRSWGRRFDRVELHPFVKVLSCCEEAREELIKQVLLFITCNKSYGINEVVRFLRPFIMFSMIWKTTSTSIYYFARNLISAIASLSCSFTSEAISLLKLLAESLKYLPLTNEEEFHYILCSAVHIVDACVVFLQQSVDIDKDLVNDAQRISVDVLGMLLSICTYFHRKPLGQVQAVIEISRNLLLAQKELGMHYVFEFANIAVSASVILTQVEFEHDQLSILKLLILLMEWKTEELSTKIVSNSLNEELLIVFPAINLLSSPSKSVKAAVTHLLSIAESFVLNFIANLTKEEISCTESPVLNEAECIPLRLFHHLFSQGQQMPFHSYLFFFTSDKVTCDIEKHCGPLYWTSWLMDHLSPIERAKATFLPQFSENYYEGVNILLGSIASSLVISSSLHTSAIDSLAALCLLDPKLGMTMFQAALFYINILLKFESNSSRILLSFLEMLPSVASHSAMVQIVVQTILPMLHKDAKPSLHALAIRLLCKTWILSDRVFENLQDVLSQKTLSNFKSVREICVSLAASVRDVCKHNPDRGVDLILSVSACIESDDSIVKALGLQSLSSLCEADVVDFYTAWEVVEEHISSYTEEPIVAASLVALLRWGALDAEAYPHFARSVLLILWKVATLKNHSLEFLWAKARSFAFQSMMQYEIVKFQEIIPEFKENNLQCLFNESNTEVLEAMEEFEVKIINFEHINRRREIKERRPLAYKVEKLLDVFPQALFSPGAGNPNGNAREFPGAALLSYAFTPKELHGISNDVPRIHASFEKALVEIAESLPLSRNLLITLLALESWKAFMLQWIKTLITSDAQSSSIILDDGLKSAGDILKICLKVAVEAVPQVSINTALAIGALCLVVPSSSHAIISSASDFLLNWLVDCEHEHHQWVSAISLGLISNFFHATDGMQKMNVLTALMKEACNSKSHLVIGACGLGLGFACEGLLAKIEFDSNRLMEENLLRNIIKTLTMALCQLCPHAFDSLENLIGSFNLDAYDSLETSSLLSQWKLDSLEEEVEPWGVAGLVVGLGNCVTAMYRLGVNDAVLIVKDILLSWIPCLESSNKSSLFGNEMTDISLAVGACIAIPRIVAFCQNVDLMIGDIKGILNRYVAIISLLLSSKESGIHHQNLVMATCIGAGSFLSCILSDGMHSMRYDDIKNLLEVLRNGYSKSHPPLVQLGAMIGVVNAFGAAAGNLTYKHRQPSFLPITLDLKGSDLVSGPIILNPSCENLFTSFVQELFLIAKEYKDPQIRKFAGWAVSFLRHKWRSENFDDIDCSNSTPTVSTLQPQSYEESLVWKMCLWLSNIDYRQVHSCTVVAVLRCISKAPRLPVLNWASIIRGFMKNAAHFTNKSQKLHDATLLAEECIYFCLARAKDVKSLLLFLDDLVDLSRFRTLDLNLQCLILRHVFDLMNIFSALRIVRLFQNFAQYFCSASSLFFVYGSNHQVLLRISFWKGLYQCLSDAHLESSCVSEIEKCIECLFSFLPTFVYKNKSEEVWPIHSEWSEGIRCLTKARQVWLIELLQFSSHSTHDEIAIRILAKVRVVKNGGLSFSELEKLKSYVLNFRLEGMCWTVLVELVAALSVAEVGIKRQWLLDALDVSCVSEDPLTAISFIGLLSGSCCKYMPLLIVEPWIVLTDLPITLPSLLSSSSWITIAESIVDKLWLSTERIAAWSLELSGGAIDELRNSYHVNESNVDTSVSLARLMYQTCLSLKDYLPLDRRLKLANLEVP